MNYREEMQVTEKYKKEYVEGINEVLEKRQKEAEIIRDNYLKDIFKNQEKYRDDFKNMLGWPLVDYKTEGLPDVTMEKLSDEDGYEIFRAQFEVIEGLKMTGLFFKAQGDEKKPMVIVQHGGMGTPERISGIYDETHNYNDMLHRVRKHDVHVFAPQLSLWHDDYNVAYDRKGIDARLKRVGSSITAVEIFGIMRIMDYFENQSYVSSFGMVGLSYGGFYTLFTTAVDTRIKSAISCAYFNARDVVGWSDWVWYKAAEKFDDAEIACLVYPRNICIEIANNDELFECKYGVESFEKVKKICAEVGTEWVELKVFDGVHEFCWNDTPIEKLINDLK